MPLKIAYWHGKGKRVLARFVGFAVELAIRAGGVVQYPSPPSLILARWVAVAAEATSTVPLAVASLLT
jgi:hypothetical protein